MIFGIDPGVSGAIVLLADSGSLVWAKRTPLVAGEYDLQAMRECLLDAVALPFPSRAALEQVRAATIHGRQQGGSSMFTFGKGYGIWIGLIAALKLPRVDVPPQRWAKLLDGMPRVERPPLKLGQPQAEALAEARKLSAAAQLQRKQNAVTRALQLCPGLPIKRKADWPMADAFLVAEWARRHLTGDAGPRQS